jgi:hypothetical protein
MSVESEINIYKAVVRPIMTYGAESRADSTKRKQILKSTEINILRAILSKKRFDRMKCSIQEVAKFVKCRRKAWNEHVGTAEQRLIILVRDDRPNSKRSPGRLPNRWADIWQSSFAGAP